MGRRFFENRGAVSVAALVCIALMLVSVNILAARYLNARLDLTQGGFYTLSSGTRHTLADIDEPITLRFYYSTELGTAVPSYGVYAARVRGLLDQYVEAAHGKLRLEVFHPQPFSSVEDSAIAFGLKGVPLDTQGDQVYFGLAGTNSTDDKQVIPFFQPARAPFLEYDLTRLIHSLAFPKKTVVGLMTGLPLAGDMNAIMAGQPSQPQAILTELDQLDDVEPLAMDVTSIPANVDVLMLVQPQDLSQQTLYAIDQFVLKGGKAVVFVDPYSEVQAAQESQMSTPGASSASDLPSLFKSWGIEVPPDLVAADRRNARRVGVPVPGGGTQAMDYVAWLDLRGRELNHHDPITADLSQVTMATSGIIRKLKGGTTSIEPLITTSTDAETLPVAKVTGLPDVATLLSQFRPTGQRYTLAAQITGPVSSAFPGGPPPPPKPASGAKPAAGPAKPPPQSAFVAKSLRPINVVVVADTDMLDDRFWAQKQDFYGQQVIMPLANNGDFVADAIDVLAGGEDLVGLRSRGTSARPFVLVDSIQRAADARFSAEQERLEAKLTQTAARLKTMTGQTAANSAAALSPAERKAIDQFRADMLRTRERLRQVQRSLRGAIERLKAICEFADIALVPILLAAAAIVIGVVRGRRRRRRPTHA